MHALNQDVGLGCMMEALEDARLGRLLKPSAAKAVASLFPEVALVSRICDVTRCVMGQTCETLLGGLESLGRNVCKWRR